MMSKRVWRHLRIIADYKYSDTDQLIGSLFKSRCPTHQLNVYFETGKSAAQWTHVDNGAPQNKLSLKAKKEVLNFSIGRLID